MCPGNAKAAEWRPVATGPRMRIALSLSLLPLVLAAGCSGPTADLSALGNPAPKLVGHWATDAGDQLYYGPVDATSGGSRNRPTASQRM